MLDFVKPYLPSNTPMLDQAVYWMNKYQREAFFEALHALGVPISPGMLSGLIRSHAKMLDVAAAYTAFDRWTAQGVPATIEVWKALACSHVYQPNPQARLGKHSAFLRAICMKHACCTALPGIHLYCGLSRACLLLSTLEQWATIFVCQPPCRHTAHVHAPQWCCHQT